MSIMTNFNKWMEDEFGYSWDTHKESLESEGYSFIDVYEELNALAKEWAYADKEEEL